MRLMGKPGGVMREKFVERRLCAGRLAAVVLAAGLATTLASTASAAASGIGLATTIDGTLTPFDPATGTPGPGAAGNAVAEAISPDGRTAWIVNRGAADSDPGTITPVDLTASPPAVGIPVAITGATSSQACGASPRDRNGVNAIALTPDGTHAYVTDAATDTVYPVDLEPPVKARPAIALAAGAQPDGIAITPDGTTAYVTNAGDDSVTPIDLATGTTGTPLHLHTGSQPSAIAITPDGRTAYVAEAGRASAVPITLARRAIGAEIATGGIPGGVAISADGTTAYVSDGGRVVACGGTPAAQVSEISTATNHVTRTDSTAFPGGDLGPALTPDGRRVYTTSGGAGNGVATGFVNVIDTATGNQLPGFRAGFNQTDVAIAPDQAPVAAFNVGGGNPGSPITFDASGSTTPAGTIARYEWDFGDGQHAADAGPSTTHVYASPGSYPVTLRVTNSVGTSTRRVFTGRMVLRNGGPSAQASRSIEITTAALPVASLSASLLNLGRALPGTSGPAQSLTISNTGAADLVLGALTLTGPGASSFRIGSDHCSGATLRPGAACMVATSFAPAAEGEFTASITIPDNANGPQTVTLRGLSTRLAEIKGVVRDSRKPDAPPVAGAQIEICPSSGIHGEFCVHRTTDASGSYDADGVKPGPTNIEVTAGDATLFPGSAVVTPAPAQVLTHDFRLHAPLPLSDGIKIIRADGTVSTGVPRLYWTDPFTVRVPVQIDQTERPNSRRLYITLVQVSTDDGSGASGSSGVNLADAVMFLVNYGPDGHPKSISHGIEAFGKMRPTQAPGAGADRGGLPGARRVARAAEAGGCVGGGFGVFPNADGGVQLEMPWVDGNFTWDLNPIQIPEPDPTGNGFVDWAANALVEASNKVIDDAPVVGSFNQAVRAANAGAYALNGDYAGAARSVLENFGFDALGSHFHADHLHSDAGRFHGAARYAAWKVATNVGTQAADTWAPDSSGAAPSCSRSAANGYIDPSGHVVNRAGVPLRHAKVILTRSATATGRVTQVPNGSVIMSPANRRNPDYTNRDGHFGWDVLPGFYRVRASLSKCRSTASTKLMQIPPPVDDLLLRLNCPVPPRKSTRASLRRLRHRGDPAGVVVLRASVAAAKGRSKPTGLVIFRRGRTVLASAPLDARGVADIAAPVARARRGQLSVAYLGNGLYAPSRASS